MCDFKLSKKGMVFNMEKLILEQLIKLSNKIDETKAEIKELSKKIDESHKTQEEKIMDYVDEKFKEQEKNLLKQMDETLEQNVDEISEIVRNIF